MLCVVGMINTGRHQMSKIKDEAIVAIQKLICKENEKPEPSTIEEAEERATNLYKQISKIIFDAFIQDTILKALREFLGLKGKMMTDDRIQGQDAKSIDVSFGTGDLDIDKLVQFVFPESGNEGDQNQASMFLVPGQIYTAIELHIGGFHSTVALKEVPKQRFNAIPFQEVPESFIEEDEDEDD